MVAESSPLDLTSCDREPIHIPGSIQPHGILLALDPESFTVVQVAGDTVGVMGQEIDQVLDTVIDDVLDTETASIVRSSALTIMPDPLYLGSLSAAADRSRPLDLAAHKRDGVLILELEPGTHRPATAAHMLATVRKVGAELETAPDLKGLLEIACHEVRRLTGFDRVMVYRFLEDGTGSVEAEDRGHDLDRPLNHRYPASDIPKQARALYLQNHIRTIPDVGYTPAPLVPATNPTTGRTLDMSDCVLRSVSPIHVQYLKNMGVAASMSVSIVVDGALWGLISCHHKAPKQVPYELREACKQLGQLLSQQIKAREEAEVHRQSLCLATRREEFLEFLGRAAPLEQYLLGHADLVRNLLPSDGAAVVFRNEVCIVGHVPAEAAVRELAQWLRQPSLARPYATHSLPGQYPPAKEYARAASGLLATVVSPEEPLVLLWFRAEQLETINWAGNPHKPAEPGDDPGTLTPRKSFEDWKETVREQSRPWSAAEIDAARKLGRAILDLRQQHALAELNVQLRRTLSDKEVLLAQKELLMQEVNHRVQNSLQLVNSMLHVQARQIADAEMRAHFDEASRRILAVSTVHQRLWRSEHIQNVEFGSFLEDLRDGLIETWGAVWAEHIRIHARPILIPTDQAVIMALVVTELLTNAVKHAYDGRPGPIDVTVKEEAGRVVRVTVRDLGVGMKSAPSRTGLGSRLTNSLIAQLGGELEVASRDRGTSASFSVPLRH